MNIFFSADREYPVVRTNETIEGLQLKAGLLPEGPDIFRQTEDEIRKAFEAGPVAYDISHVPLDRQLDSRRRTMPLFGEREDPSEEEETEAIIERASEDIWTHQSRPDVEVVGSKVIATTRDRENMSYSGRWVFETAPAVQAEVFVIPDVIGVDGLKLVLQGRYRPAAWEYIPPYNAQKDPNGWRLFANVNYDFDLKSGTIKFN